VSVASIVVGGVLLLIGGGIGFYGYRRFRVSRAIKSTPTTPVEKLDSAGQIEIEGTVVADESMTSPIGADEGTVLSAWKAKEWNESRNTSDSWKQLGAGITAKPFIVDDGTGHVVVDPQRDIVGESELLYGDDGTSIGGNLGIGFAGMHIGLGRFLPSLDSGVSTAGVVAEFDSFDVAYEDEVTDSTPDRIADFLVQQPNVRPQLGGGGGVVDVGNKNGDRRYYEGTIQDGDSVYVLGDVRATEEGGSVSGPSDGVIQPPEGDGLFVVSTISESELRRRTRWQKLALGVGAVIGLFGLGTILTGVAGLL